MSKIKNLRDLLQQDPQVSELLTQLSALSGRVREVVEPKAVSFGELLAKLREDAVVAARDTMSDVKEDVNETVSGLAEFFREQGFEVEIHKVTPAAGKTIEPEEDFVAAVQRLLGEAAVADCISEPTDEELAEAMIKQLLAGVDKHDDLSPDEMWELINMQDDLLADYATKVEQLEAQLAAQAKLSEGANARCTGLHEGILSALGLIDCLDILSAQEHLRFALRQAGVSDCNVAG